MHTTTELIESYHQHNQLTSEERDQLIQYFNFNAVRDPHLNEHLHAKFLKLVFLLDNGSSFSKDANKRAITFEGVSSLLDFIELKHARKNAKEARTFSLWALLFSVFSIVISSSLGYLQLNAKIELEDSS